MKNLLTQWVRSANMLTILMIGLWALSSPAQAAWNVDFQWYPTADPSAVGTCIAGQSTTFTASIAGAPPFGLVQYLWKFSGCTAAGTCPQGQDRQTVAWTYPEPRDPNSVQLEVRITPPGATNYESRSTLKPVPVIGSSGFTVHVLPAAGCTVLAGDGGVDAAEPDGNGIVCSEGMAADDPLCTEQFTDSEVAALKVVPEPGYWFNGWIVDGAHIELTSAEPLFLSKRPVLAGNVTDVQIQNGSTDTQADCSLNAFTLYKVNHGEAISDKDKAKTGTYLSINHDDDNGDGQPDNENSTIDGDEDQRDLAKVTLKANVSTEMILSADMPTHVRLFDDSGSAMTLPATVMPEQLAGGMTYWVEGMTVGTVLLSVKNADETLEDMVKLVVGEDIGIKLTFDDGPYVANDLAKKVLMTLANNTIENSIKATFFVQTHAVPGGGSAGGPELIAETGAVYQHHVEVHTGAKEGHISHVKRESFFLLKMPMVME